jgi:hypothetical protein
VEHAVIVDVEPSTAVRQAEVTAAKTMIERTHDRFVPTSAEHHRADCRIFTIADRAVLAEQFHSRTVPNNATRLSGKDWLCTATRA